MSTAGVPSDLHAKIHAQTEWSVGHRLRHAAQSVLGRAYPRIFGMSREPSWLFFDLVFPVLGMCSFVFLLRSRGADEAWISATILASALLTFWTSVIWMMAGQFRWERDSGNMTLYITAPVGLGSIALGMAFGGAVGMAFRAGIIIVGGSLIFGAQYQIQDPFLLVACLLVAIQLLFAPVRFRLQLFRIEIGAADHHDR